MSGSFNQWSFHRELCSWSSDSFADLNLPIDLGGADETRDSDFWIVCAELSLSFDLAGADPPGHWILYAELSLSFDLAGAVEHAILIAELFCAEFMFSPCLVESDLNSTVDTVST